jgi:hypothetical protein
MQTALGGGPVSGSQFSAHHVDAEGKSTPSAAVADRSNNLIEARHCASQRYFASAAAGSARPLPSLGVPQAIDDAPGKFHRLVRRPDAFPVGNYRGALARLRGLVGGDGDFRAVG